MLALLEDKKAGLDDPVDLEKGVWQVSRRTVYDSERHGKNKVTLKQAFELSSNVGMAKMVWSNYSKSPLQYIDHLKKLHLNEYSGIDLVGETRPIVKTPKSKTWSATTLPWMSFGYEVLVSPLQTLMLYNAVANDGKMMKPYLVSEVKQAGITLKNFGPQVVEEAICSESTLKKLQECLVGVCSERNGTGYKLFLNSVYPVAGKTGTALVANGKRGYADHIYQSSFAGYFPANDPKYSCIVVIKNKPFAKKFYGASVAGPVFKEVADKLYALDAEGEKQKKIETVSDSSNYWYAGNSSDMRTILQKIGMRYHDSAGKSDYNVLAGASYQPTIKDKPVAGNKMPDIKGMGLKDVLFILENKQVKVVAKGRGKVTSQSVTAGVPLAQGQTVMVQLN
jgi:cell division protein FtsI (penicillin-binding protein 3)